MYCPIPLTKAIAETILPVALNSFRKRGTLERSTALFPKLFASGKCTPVLKPSESGSSSIAIHFAPDQSCSLYSQVAKQETGLQADARPNLFHILTRQ